MIDSSSLSVSSVGSIPNTETPPPGYMSEDGDPMDQNDNMSESLLVSPDEWTGRWAFWVNLARDSEITIMIVKGFFLFMATR